MNVIKKLGYVYLEPEYHEEFRVITYPGVKEGKYKISNYGRVWNIEKEFIMKDSPNKDNHMRITLVSNEENTNKHRRGNAPKHYFVHRLVAWEFIGPPKDDYNVIINHKNGIPCCNFVHNLEWTSVLGNTNHAKETGLMNERGLNSSSNIYSEHKVRKICSLLEKGYNNVEIFELMAGHKNYKSNKKYNGLYNLINKLSKRVSYRDIVVEYNYLPDISYFYCDKNVGKIRQCIYRGYHNLQIMKEFGYNDVSDNRTLYNRIIAERAKCEVLFNDYRKTSLEEISKLIIE